jgi:hypothetical protein
MARGRSADEQSKENKRAPRLGRVDDANGSDASSSRWLSDTVPSEERIELSSHSYAAEVLLQAER